jgi:UDP-2,3-diacylglucosamine pyrophosphatase LpxH
LPGESHKSDTAIGHTRTRGDEQRSGQIQNRIPVQYPSRNLRLSGRPSPGLLVGDVVDVWRLKRGWHWPQSHKDVLQALLARAQAGARIVFIPGNHDELFRSCPGISAASTSRRAPPSSPRTAGASSSPTATSSTRWRSTPGG